MATTDSEYVGYSGGSTSGGVDTLSGGAGRDTYRVYGYDARYSLTNLRTDVITDFEAGQGGDVLDLSNVINYLSGWTNGTNPFTSAHLRLLADGADTLVQMDWDGAGASGTWQSLVRLQGVAPSSLGVSNFSPSYTPNDTGVSVTGTALAEVFHGTELSDTISGQDGNDTLYGNGGNYTLTGGSGDDQVQGDEGNDTLAGGIGNDALCGGAGRDTYRVYGYDARYSLTNLRTDVITDFEAGQGGDVLDLSNVINYLSGWTNGTNPFTSAHLRLLADGADTLVQMDWDGAGASGTWQSLVRLQGVAPSSLGDNFL